jgi:hypothetical protein
MTFLTRVIVGIDENCGCEGLRISRQQRPQAGFSPDIGQPFGENAAGQIEAGRERPPRGQRVLDAPSGARAGGRVLAASGTFNRLSLKDEIWSTAAMIP